MPEARTLFRGLGKAHGFAVVPKALDNFNQLRLAMITAHPAPGYTLS